MHPSRVEHFQPHESTAYFYDQVQQVAYLPPLSNNFGSSESCTMQSKQSWNTGSDQQASLYASNDKRDAASEGLLLEGTLLYQCLASTRKSSCEFTCKSKKLSMTGE